MNGTELSVIVPVYCNRETLESLCAEVAATFATALPPGALEVVFVDDGSLDDSLAVLKTLAARHPDFVRVIRLSRNFGSHAAILAGLSHCRGRHAAVIGADLQESPAIVLEMLEKARTESAEVVLACRAAREEGWSKVAFANLYYWLMRRLSQARFPPGGFDAFLVTRPVIDAIVRLSEKDTSITALILWMGFRQAQVHYVKVARAAGRSRWTLRKKLHLLADSFVSFSHTPIRAIQVLGVLTAAAGLTYAAVVVVLRLTGRLPDVPGWASLMVVFLVVSGILLLSLGVVGEYLWRILDASRGRPVFLVAETWNLGDGSARKETES